MSKNMILSCPQMGTDRIQFIKSNIAAWLSVPELHKLAKAFDGTVPKTADTRELADWYLKFSDCWDFRGKQKQAFDNKVGEGARWLLSDSELSSEQREATLKAASALGLADNDIPGSDDFDYIWVLGGAKLSCLLRARLAKSVIGKANKPPKAVVMLASMRSVGDGEREATDTYAPGAATEFDLFLAAAQAEFGVGAIFDEERFDDSNNTNNSWIVRKCQTNICDIFIIAAPSSEPEKRRANSADTYEFFFNRFQADEGAKILLTTSQIYVPYQHLEAIRTIAIPHRINLDTIGFAPEWGGELQGMNGTTNYLQEIRSTIQAIDRFLTQYER